MDAAQLLGAMKRTVEQLAAFNDIAKALTSTLETNEVLELVMEKISHLLNPSSWSLLLEGDDGQLYFEICVGPAAETLKTMRIPIGEGIAGSVFRSQKPRLVSNARADADFSTRFDEVSRFRTASLLAVPLISHGKSLGVIELVNAEGAPAFTDEDMQTVLGISEFAAIAIENARNFKRVHELLQTDEHTGLFNARYLKTQLTREVARSERFARPISLLFLDVDHFKEVNDQHGHLVGSAVLKEIGEVIASTIRGIDSAYRYGGDEFAVLLLETHAQGAAEVARRLVNAVHSRNYTGLDKPVTVSVGVAAFPDHAGTTIDLLDAADKAMYRAKKNGRDQMMVAAERFPAPEPSPGHLRRRSIQQLKAPEPVSDGKKAP